MPATIRSGALADEPERRRSGRSRPACRRWRSRASRRAAPPRSRSARRSIVMPRPTALRFESGAITDTVPTSSSATLRGEEAARGDAVVVGEQDAHARPEALRGPAVSCTGCRPRARIPDRDRARLVVRCWEPRRRPAAEGRRSTRASTICAPWMPWAEARAPDARRRRSELLRDVPRASSTSAATTPSTGSSTPPTERRVSAAPACTRASARARARSATGSGPTRSAAGYATESTAALTRVGVRGRRRRPDRDPLRACERRAAPPSRRSSATR